MLNFKKIIHISTDSVIIDKKIYSKIQMWDVLLELAQRVSVKNASLLAYKRHQVPESPLSLTNTYDISKNAKLSQRDVKQQINQLLTSNTSLVVETGDSWFVAQKLKMPTNSMFHVQLQYGSIG